MKIEQLNSGKLSLVNDGALALFFVGTGSAFTKTLNQNNLVVVKGADHLVVDCGTKCTQGLYEAGVGAAELRNFLVTHTHADHIGGLEEVMMVGRYLVRRKPSIIINEEFQEILWEHSLRGGSAYSETHDGRPLGFEDFWNPLRPTRVRGAPRETWEYQLGAINIKFPRTKHFPDNATSWQDSFWSCGLILDERVLFTADTRFDPELVLEFDRRYHFEYIFHDCQFFNGGVHASLDELATLPPEVRRRIILMHYGDNWQQYQEGALGLGFHSFARQSHYYLFPPP
jgi:ribonuclease BN (tRNA processing enzyme)